MAVVGGASGRRAVPGLLAPPRSPTGALLAALMLVGSLLPSLLPRATSGQVLVSSLAVVTGYALGATTGALARLVVRDRWPVPALRRQLGALAWLLAGVVALVAVVLSPRRMGWIGEQAAAIGASTGAPSWPLVIVGTALAAFVLLVVARALRAGGRGLGRLVVRAMPAHRTAAAWLGGLAMAAVVVLVVAGAYLATARVFTSIDQQTAGQSPPTSSDRSGGPGSLVPFDSLGAEGRTWVSSGPTREQIAAFRPANAGAPEPIRVFAGLESAPTPQQRARLVVEELRRTKAFEREAVVVITTTGNGFIDPVAADALEYVLGGDVASAGMQYSVLPSWLSFLVDKGGSQEAGVVLLREVRAAIDALPETARPRLYVYGESLGAFGSLAAFDGLSPEQAAQQVDGGLWVGPPSTSATWGQWTATATGGPAWAPTTAPLGPLRFAADTAGIEAPWPYGLGPAGYRPTHLLVVQHATDPVVWFDPTLAFARPAWLDDPRGPGVPSQARWWPVLFVEQVAMDLAPAGSAPRGAGHDYGEEVPAAWVSVLAPEDWTAADTERLTQAVG